MFTLEENAIIYVLCPAGIVTGGIEAIHQLVHKLRQFGHDARIIPTPRVRNPLLLQYRNYDVIFAGEIIDHERNVLITTEVNPLALNSFHAIQKAVWWLSVDNHEDLANKFDFENPQAATVLHFAQSAYAVAFLEGKARCGAQLLTDYLHPIYFHNKPLLRKNNIVLYTPIKGAQAYIDKLQRADPSIQWVPLAGMIRKMHAQTLRHGKVYVDFGRHPGKDRQPREAVVNGCCVIVGLAGAARFHADIPIPERYKFERQQFNHAIVLETIYDCLFSHEKRFRDFDAYVDVVRNDERRFEGEIAAIFGVKSHRNPTARIISLANILRFARQNDAFTTTRGLINELCPLPVSRVAKNLYGPIATRFLNPPGH